MYTLYYSPGAASLIVHVALLETGVDYELKLVDLQSKQQKDPAYLQLNPNGVVPTLLIDGKPYLESAALLMLLAERYPQAGLVPPAASAAYDEWRQWIIYLSNNLQSIFRLWFIPTDLGYEEHPPAIRDALQTRIASIWDRLEQHLAKNGPYLLGGTFSAADLYLTMLMRWSRRMPRPATGWPALEQLAHLVTARPSWKKMMEIEGIEAWPLHKTK